MMLAAPELEAQTASNCLLRRQRGMHRFEWPDTAGIEFHLSPGDWIRILRANDFEIEDLIEVYPSDGATTRFTATTLTWAQAWPCDEVWKARKRR